MHKPHAHLSRREILAYGLLNLPLAIAGLPLAIYLPPFYAQEVGVDLAAVGFLLMLARITDVVTDPFIGAWSDRWQTPIGRRRPWVIMGVPVMVVGTWMLFVPQEGAGGIYMLVWTSILYLGWTMVSIPYSAWGAELTPDYHERTRLTGAREVFQLLGLLIATSIPALLAQQAGGKLGPTLRVLCEMTVVLLPLAALLLLVMVREAPVTPAPHLPWAKSLSIAWRNAPFRRLLFASVIGSLASSVNLSLAVLFYGHAMHLQNEANTLIFFYIVIGVLAAPFWLLLARKVSKHRLICIAGLWGCFWFCTVPFLPPGEFWPMMIVNLLSGLNVAVAPILFPSMAADAVDLDRLRSRKQRAALFFGLWAMGAKLATAVGVGVALPLLALAGFNAQGVNGPEQIFWLKVLYVALPVALWLVTIAMLWTYPITPERQARFRARIERRYGTALPPAPTI